MKKEILDFDKFLPLIKLLEENYDKQLSDAIFGIWYNELGGYEEDLLRRAIIECIKQYNNFPTINQVKKEILEDFDANYIRV